jgi:xylose isomerase
MRTYLSLKDKAARFHTDPDIAEALEAAGVAGLEEPTRPTGGIATLRAMSHDPEVPARRGYGIERLDQLVTELLLGVR